MGKWGLLLGGLIVWAVDFFALYAIASILPGTSFVARALAIVVTLAALAADAWLIRFAWKAAGSAGDEVDGWIARTGLAGAALSFVSVLWQGFPAILA
ncbi:MAG TPA: hypothetical protein VMK31_08955 [Sphingomicrobium sp.]|nr:hypothetical protein [Sphingomicrobium sp.]